MNIQINDCTIRDGGYLLAKNPPVQLVEGIIDGLKSAGIDIIEIGFLQSEMNGESIIYANSIGARKYIRDESDSARFTGFCDNSRYSLENLDNHDGKTFDYLRISFAKHESEEALKFVEGAKNKGYKVFANPMDAPSYTAEERSAMIKKVNEIKPYAFSIVDTFGTMYLNDLKDIFLQTDRELDKSVKIGLHTHNNLQLSSALSETMADLAAEVDRDIVVDGSLYGMGRGAGNASTETLAEFFNSRYGKNYDIAALFDTIEKYILPLVPNVSWGYDLYMFACGIQGSHVDNVYRLLSMDNNICASDILRILRDLNTGQRKRYGENYSKTDFSALEKMYEMFRSKNENGDVP